MSENVSRSEREFALNGLTVQTLRLSQDGELEVEFDLPSPQSTPQYYTRVRGLRTLNVYDDDELQDLCKQIFNVIRRRVMEPDPERVKVHCDRCATSPCCRNYNVLITDEDIARLAKGLGVRLEDFKKEFTRPAVDWSDDFAAQLACDNDDDDEEKCVFLKPTASGQFRCSVYEHRPQICRDFDMDTCDDFVAVEEVGVLKQD